MYLGKIPEVFRRLGVAAEAKGSCEPALPLQSSRISG
jgi:hypothetical protein